MELRVVCVAFFLFLAGPALANNDNGSINFASVTAMNTMRTNFINLMYGQNTLPTTLATVASNVGSTCGSASPPCYTGSTIGTNVGRIDRYTSSMTNGQTYTSYLYAANSPNNGRVVVVNMGHQETCSWPSFASGYNTAPLLTALVNAGYSVFAYNMPRPTPGPCGDTTDHNNMFTSYADGAMQYFFEPLNEAENYWDANKSFSRYDMVGLSGGGWTTTVWAAMDPRIGVSVPVAGSVPAQYPNSGCDGGGDAEQGRINYYNIAGYLDMYLMAASGAGHRQLQILNIGDNCCFGPAQYTCSGGVFAGVSTWYGWLNKYTSNLQSGAATASITPQGQTPPGGTPYRYTLIQDPTSTQHQISNPYAVGLIINAMANATGGRHR